jgi:hypothetical protein
MNKIVFISPTNSINCIFCSNQISSNCDDSSFNITGLTIISNEIYCQVNLKFYLMKFKIISFRKL